MTRYDVLRDLVTFVQFQKNMKNTHGGVLLFVKVSLLYGCFSRFLNCTNSTKSPKASSIMRNITKNNK